MQITINLFDHLLETGRRYHELGRHRDAVTALTRSSAFREVPAEVAEETQARLGELQLKRRKYAPRRHLVAALRHRPDQARYHHLMGLACQEEDRGNLERAAKHYRRSLELDATAVPCLVDFGLLAIRLGRHDEGLARLREATALAPDDPNATARLVKGLRQLGKPDNARAEVRAALFRNARDPRFRRLWNEYQFRELRRKQDPPGTTRRTARTNQFCCHLSGRGPSGRPRSATTVRRPSRRRGVPSQRIEVITSGNAGRLHDLVRHDSVHFLVRQACE